MLRRRHTRLKQLPKLIICCEGLVTEPCYFDGARRARRIQRERVVIHAGCGVPRSVVEYAIRVKKENARQNRLDRIDVSDPVWAVFDRDDHPEIPQAKAMAVANGIDVAFNNPCFELFLYLHFQPLNRDLHRDAVTRLLSEQIPGYDKYLDYEKAGLDERYDLAKQNIQTANKGSEIIGGIESAPYCSTHDLVDYLRNMSE